MQNKMDASLMQSPPPRMPPPKKSVMCTSPLSSAEDEFEFDPERIDKENVAPAQRRVLKGRVRKGKAKRDANEAEGGAKRRRVTKVEIQDKESTIAERVPTKRGLIATASERFVTYLASQLEHKTQSQLSESFGQGQGFLVTLPTLWHAPRECRALGEWLEQLGFQRLVYEHSVFRLSSLHTKIVQRALRERGVHVHLDDAVETEDLEDEHKSAEKSAFAKAQASLATCRDIFKQLDAQELEIMSVTEHARLLSTVRHEEIADAMENVLSLPSLRKERYRANRISKLERVSMRRLSVLPLRSSSINPISESEDLNLGALSIRKSMPRTPARSSTRSTMTPIEEMMEESSVFGRESLQLFLNSGFIAVSDIRSVVCRVSKLWREAGLCAFAWSVADYAAPSQRRDMSRVYEVCPRGHYLADGAYKEVFKVFSTLNKRLEAISIMDIQAIERTGNEHIVRQEVAHSVLLSELVRTGVSPHFLEVYDVFVATQKPDPSRWGSATCRKPVDLFSETVLPSYKNPDQSVGVLSDDGIFQYIRMEFCDGGNMEDFINLQQNKRLPLASVAVPFFFQMAFGVYCARERCTFRHCDLKLLNFFLKDISRQALTEPVVDSLTIRYPLGEKTFDVAMPDTFSYWVKLADYGTADSNADNIGQHVTVDQFTTLENCPIEFLLEGDQALQSFAADTFSLGLCLLHLFTGSSPYEETLEEVRCPAPLLQKLKSLWMSTRKNSSFSVIRRVLVGDHDDMLIHTLYRYIVLFGLPNVNPSAERGIDRVWNLLVKYLRPDDGGALLRPRRTRRAEVAGEMPHEQFEKDCQQFNLDHGAHPSIVCGRERMNRLPAAADLLHRLVDFNPTKRPTMKSVLLDPFFQSLHSKADHPAHVVIDTYSSEKLAGGCLPNL